MDKQTRKNIISAVITVALLAVALGAYYKLSGMKKSTVSEGPVKKERRKVNYQSYDLETVDNNIEIDGRLNAYQSVAVTSKVQGIMLPSSKNLRKGMYVKKGELLFAIDKQEVEYTLKAQKSSLMNAITQIMADLKFDYPQSFPIWQSYLSAFDENQPIRPLPKPANDQEKYFIAGKNLYNQYYNIKSLETRLADYNVYAPFSGVVTEINLYPGALISPGQVLATMINTSLYEIEAPVPMESLKYVSVGQKVLLNSTELDKTWTAKVSRIGTQIDPNTQNIPLFITVQGKGLKDGMYLKGELRGKAIQDVYQLPKEVLVTPTSVYVIEDSTIVAKTVEPQKRLDKTIILKGISPEDKVIVGALAGLFEGQKVDY